MADQVGQVGAVDGGVAEAGGGQVAVGVVAAAAHLDQGAGPAFGAEGCEARLAGGDAGVGEHLVEARARANLASGGNRRAGEHIARLRAVDVSLARFRMKEPADEEHLFPEIAQRLEQISQSVVQVNQGSLYPALHRLEQKKWLRAEWKQSETGREARFYSLTPAGRKQLAEEKNSWARLAGAVQLIFDEGEQS